MVRTQLYLSKDVYDLLKKKAKAKGMTFAGFVRIYLEREVFDEGAKEKALYQAYPFLKCAGMIKGFPSDSKKVDEIYDL